MWTKPLLSAHLERGIAIRLWQLYAKANKKKFLRTAT